DRRLRGQRAPMVSRTSLRSVSSNSRKFNADSHSSQSTSSTAGRLSSDTSTRPPSTFTTCICSVLTRNFRSLPQLGQVKFTYRSFERGSYEMVGADAMQIGPISADFARFSLIFYNFAVITTASGTPEIHSEARGPHWIAWVSRDGSGKPSGSVILVAETRELAEARAARWAEPTLY